MVIFLLLFLYMKAALGGQQQLWTILRPLGHFLIFPKPHVKERPAYSIVCSVLPEALDATLQLARDECEGTADMYKEGIILQICFAA